MQYAVSDIHGCYDKYIKLLHRINLKDSDTLYILGDMIDRGPDGLKILLDISMRPNIVPFLGNHEYAALTCLPWLMEELTEENTEPDVLMWRLKSVQGWMADGGDKTVEEFRKLPPEARQDVLDILEDLTVYEEVEAGGGELVLVHAGLGGFSPEKAMDDYQLDELILSRPEPGQDYFKDRYLVFGHTPTPYYTRVRPEDARIFRCEHTSVRKPVTGVCTSCGKESALPNAAHNSKIACPHCRRELTVKSIGKTGRTYDRDTVQVIEKISDNEVTVRIMKVWYNYDRDHLMPMVRIHENTLAFVRHGPDGKAVTEPYYYSCGKGTLTHWMPGERPRFFKYCYDFEADVCGHIYCGNLPGALSGTPWEYCPVTAFYGHFHEPMQLAPFLAAYLDHPKLEHLVKVGFFNIEQRRTNQRTGYAPQFVFS